MLDRYMAVGFIPLTKGDRTGTGEAIFYLDMMAPLGERVRTNIEPIADEL